MGGVKNKIGCTERAKRKNEKREREKEMGGVKSKIGFTERENRRSGDRDEWRKDGGALKEREKEMKLR